MRHRSRRSMMTRRSVTKQTGSVGEEEQPVGLERGGQLESELVAIDVDRDALFAEGGGVSTGV